MVGFLQMKFNYRKPIFIYLIPDSPSSEVLGASTPSTKWNREEGGLDGMRKKIIIEF